MRYRHLLVTVLTTAVLLVTACAQPAVPGTPTKAVSEKSTTAATPPPTQVPANKQAATPVAPAAAKPATSPFEAKPPVVVGVVASLKGIKIPVGTSMKEGIELAAEEVNSKGGVDGRKIELIIEDDETDPDKAVAATLKLAKNNKVIAILGPSISPTTGAAAPVANAEKVAMLSPTIMADQLTAPGSGLEYFFRIGMPERLSAVKLVQYATKRWNKIGLFTYSGWIGENIRAAVTKNLAEVGKAPVAAVDRPPFTPDVTPMLLPFQKAGAEAIIVQGLSDDQYVAVKGLNQIGYKVPLIITEPMQPITEGLFDLDEGQGIISVDSVDPAKSEVRKLLETRKKKYGSDQDLLPLALVHGYDAMMVMAEALKRADFDRSKVRGALESIKDFPAVSGKAGNKISFGLGQHDGNGESSVMLWQVKGKGLVQVE